MKKEWFLERIGKRIYRDETSCKCETCKLIARVGLVIDDEVHADYLASCSAEMGIKYFDYICQRCNSTPCCCAC